MERRTRSRSTGLFLTLVAAMLLVAMVSQQSWAAGARGATKGSLAPLESGMSLIAQGAGRVIGIYGNIAALRAENERLAAQNLELRREVAELSAAGQDNQALRQALDFERAFGHKMVAAQVIGRGPDGFSRTLEIDRGSSDGIRVGMVVTTGAGLVGRVSETGPHAAILQTLSDPLSRVNVFFSKSGLEGTVVGGPDALQVEIEPRFGVVASAGEWAITSGTGGGYPRGLVVGQVASVTHRDSATTNGALVAWVNDPAAISVVLVIVDFTPS